MKFISKNANLRIILRPGLPANPMAGALAVPSIFVRFQNGVAEVREQDLIDKMKNHPGFNSDFVSVEEEALDPFLSTRQESEPAHSITQIEYGRAGKVLATPAQKKLPAELEALVREQAISLAKAMLPEMLKGLIEAGALKKVEDGPKQVEEEAGPALGVEVKKEVVEKKSKGLKKDLKKVVSAATEPEKEEVPIEA
jgi:hypothetical protein